METNDFYFLVMVLGAFAAFALAMVVATLQYKAWVKRTSKPQAASNDHEPLLLKRAA